MPKVVVRTRGAVQISPRSDIDLDFVVFGGFCCRGPKSEVDPSLIRFLELLGPRNLSLTLLILARPVAIPAAAGAPFSDPLSQ